LPLIRPSRTPRLQGSALIRARQHNLDLAHAQIIAVRDAAARTAASAKVFIYDQLLLAEKLREVSPILSEALGRAADGDTSGMAIGDALRRTLIFHGLQAGLADREEPSICAAADGILGNFIGQLTRHAREHGLRLPK
jgi:hypothetical protein